MTDTQIQISPKELVRNLLQNLPSKRMRDVIESRYALKGGETMTLEAIGKKYKITRERVRQIEADAIKLLSKKDQRDNFLSFAEKVREELAENGGVMTQNHIIQTVCEPKEKNHTMLLMELDGRINFYPENNNFNALCAVSSEQKNKAEEVINRVVSSLEKESGPVSESKLLGFTGEAFGHIYGNIPNEKVQLSTIKLSKVIAKNPYNEYGLVFWPTVSPKGVRDKAYLALLKEGKPLHFRKVSEAINKTAWSKKKAHPQTVHNELIKDKRFVLVGRGLYALSEWGYQPGVVRDVLKKVLVESGSALSKDEIIQKVLSCRFVKPETISLNLQNKNIFRKTSDNKYTLL